MILNVDHVSKSFTSGKETVRVLDKASLHLAEGEFISICGESGCGKTTFLNILAGLEPADEGNIFWNGNAIKTLSAKKLSKLRNAYLGMVFQHFYLIPELNVEENILLSLRIQKKNTRSHKDRVQELLEKVNMGNMSQAKVNNLSGGEKQRVAILRALITKPKVILADEPTGNLDERTSQAVIEMLIKLSQEEGIALILVTHDLDFAKKATRQLCLSQGHLSEIS